LPPQRRLYPRSLTRTRHNTPRLHHSISTPSSPPRRIPGRDPRPARVALLPPRGQADPAARGARPYSRRCRSSQGGRHRRARPPALAPHRFPSPSPARGLTPTSTSEYIARSTKGMVDASTVDCNAKEDDDEPGGEMCTDTTCTHFGLGPSSHTPTQRSSYYSLLFALAGTILLLSPLLLRIATRPLAEPGALRLLRFGEIGSGRQRVPATTTALSGSRVAVEPWNRGTVQGENERIANEVHHRVEVLLRLDDGDGAVPPLQEGSDSEDEDDMPPLLECSETEDKILDLQSKPHRGGLQILRLGPSLRPGMGGPMDHFSVLSLWRISLASWNLVPAVNMQIDPAVRGVDRHQQLCNPCWATPAHDCRGLNYALTHAPAPLQHST
ncbi:hypothetical protein B0H14DRAFT_3757671, partial [Mycena olivaceomarginata]